MTARSIFLVLLQTLVAPGLFPAPRARGAAPTLPPAVSFVDVTDSAGINFKHDNGAFGKKYMPETMGAGCAFWDYNNDNRQDVFLVNSMHWPEATEGQAPPCALYENRGDGNFVDVTKKAGLASPQYGMGCGMADIDNDGDDDLYLTNLGKNRLFRNNGNGTFTDVTDQAGVGVTDWSTSCAWLDYDKDGWVDLFVGHYVVWSVDKDIRCTLDGVTKSYCTPESYQGVSPRLFRNRGDGTFDDVTESAGIYQPHAKTLGNVIFDVDGDGWLDIAVANDTQPDYLYQNLGDGTFMEVGTMSGIAFNENGTARAGMGMDVSDYDHQGRFSLVVGNFSNEMIGLYRNEGNGLFIDTAAQALIGVRSLPYLTFGLFFFDVNLDGHPDLLCANGHVEDQITQVQKTITYRQRPLLYLNQGNGRFDEVGTTAGADFSHPMVGRGAAYGDLDADGDLDVLLSPNNDRARLLRNDSSHENNWVRFKLQGTKSNRNAIGSVLKLHLGATTQSQLVKAGHSYCSQSEWTLTFGLGKAKKTGRVEIHWTNGLKESFTGVTANRHYLMVEGTQQAQTLSIP